MTDKLIVELALVVKHQSEMHTLWADPIDRKSTLQEHLLRAALRHLHAIIENQPYVAKEAKSFYWYLESEL